MSTREGFGKPKEGSGIVMFKIGEGETKQFRIFPPKGRLAETGIWGIYHQQHYGYGVPNPTDPTKTRARPFLCVEEKDGEKVVTSCPECRKIEDQKRLKEEMYAAEVARLGGGPAAEGQATKLVESYTQWLSHHNLDRKWYMVAMAEDGQIGYLVVPHKAYKKMLAERKKLLAGEKIDILDMDAGAWVEFSRTGTGRSTEYDAVIAQEHTTVNGVRAKITKVTSFTDAQTNQALTLPDLDSQSIVRKISREQIRMLADGSGTPEEVEAILNMGQRVDRAEASPAPVAAPKAVVAKPVAAPTPVAAPKVDVVDPQAAQIAALQAQLAALQAKPAPKTAPVPATPAAAANALSDEDFLSKYGDAE